LNAQIDTLLTGFVDQAETISLSYSAARRKPSGTSAAELPSGTAQAVRYIRNGKTGRLAPFRKPGDELGQTLACVLPEDICRDT